MSHSQKLPHPITVLFVTFIIGCLFPLYIWHDNILEQGIKIPFNKKYSKHNESNRFSKAPEKGKKLSFKWEYSCFVNKDNNDDSGNDDNIYNNKSWSNCFNSNHYKNYTISNDGYYINKIINSNKMLLWVISTCKRNPRILNVGKCGLPINQFLVCNDFYLINNGFYHRNTTLCDKMHSNKTVYRIYCYQWIDIMFFWSYIENNYYNKHEWIALFEDDVSFCSDLFKFIWNIIENSYCSELNNINRIEFSSGNLGNMLRIKKINLYLKLVNLQWNDHMDPSKWRQMWPGLDHSTIWGLNKNKLKLKNGAYDYGFFYVTNSLLFHPTTSAKESHFRYPTITPPICYKNMTNKYRDRAIQWINQSDIHHPYWF